jgi:hypothetical protein
MVETSKTLFLRCRRTAAAANVDVQHVVDDETKDVMISMNVVVYVCTRVMFSIMKWGQYFFQRLQSRSSLLSSFCSCSCLVS